MDRISKALKVPLNTDLQDLRPLRGQPSADPVPPRLAGVYPYGVGESKRTATTSTSTI